MDALHDVSPYEPAQRVPPHNFEAEKALLGGIMANNHGLMRVADFLRPEHFADPMHGRIYDAVAKQCERGVCDPVTLRQFFEQEGALQDIGGARYLSELAASMVSIINIGDYGNLIYELYLKRQLIDVGEQIVNRAHTADLDDRPDTMIADAEARLFELTQGGAEPERDINYHLDETEKAMLRAEDSRRGIVGLPTELIDLDRKLSGLCAPDLILIAGRPSMGKTALALAIADNIAREYRAAQDENGKWIVTAGAAVAFFSLEMSAEQLNIRRVARWGNVPMENVRRGRYADPEERERAYQALKLLRGMPLYIETLREPTPQALRSRARRLVRTKGIGLIVVDYIQLMDPGIKVSNLVHGTTHISRSLKGLAKELNVPVLALSQLSRAVESRDDKRPQLADLRESGALEQDADVVIFPYREAYYLERSKPQVKAGELRESFTGRMEDWKKDFDPVANLMEAFIAKQRQGPIGTVRLLFDAATQHIDNLSDQREAAA